MVSMALWCQVGAALGSIPLDEKVTDRQAAPYLHPDQEMNFESLQRGETAMYQLGGMLPGQMYEVRVSFLGLESVNMLVKLSGIDRHGEEPELLSRFVGRQPLDTEKTMFTTDANGLVNGWQTTMVHVTCEDATVPVPGSDAAQRPVRYNIVLESLHFGAPRGVLNLAVVAAVALAVVLRFALPSVVRRARDILDEDKAS